MEELREKVAKKLKANPGVKTGMLAETLGVPEVQVLKAMPEGYATSLSTNDLEGLMTALEKLGLVYFVTRNDGCVAEIKGRFSGFSKSGPFFNVAGEQLHLHVRLDRITDVLYVTPAAEEGKPSWPSLQFYLGSGAMAFKVFLIESMQTEAGDDYQQSLNELKALAEAFSL